MLNEDLFEYINSLNLENGHSVDEKNNFLVRWGRACLDNPDLPPAFVADCLLSLSESRPQKLITFKKHNASA